MRAFWTGNIEWGMLAIPVKLYTASKDAAAKFHRLHKACSQRITTVNRCPKCAVDVEWADIVSGTEIAPGEYAVFEKDELKEIKEGGEKSVVQVIHTTAVDGLTPNLFDTTYWVGSAAKRAKAYCLLRDVLTETRAVAIGSVTLRTRPRLCMIGAQAGLLTLTTLHYEEEIVDAKELVPPELPATPKERALVAQIVESQKQPFDPSEHTDDYAKRLAEAVAEKVDEGEVVQGGEAPEKKGKAAAGADVLNLEELLSRMAKGAGAKGKAVKDAKDAATKDAAAKKSKGKGKVESDKRRAS